MKTNLGFKSETILAKLFGIVALKKVLADEGEQTGAATGGTTTQSVDVNALIEQARKEEKNKLYPKIQALESKVDTLSKEELNYLKRINDLSTKNSSLLLEVENLKKANSEVITKEEYEKVVAERDTLTTQLEDSKKNTLSEEEIRAKILKELESTNSIETHKKTVLEQNKGLIIPELVTGNTIEEINESLEKSKARFTELFGAAGGTQSQGSQGSQTETLKGGSYPSANIASAIEGGKLTLEDLAKMNPASKEYAELRKVLLGR